MSTATRKFARLSIAGFTCAGAIALFAGVAAAHVDADPLAMQAGTTGVIGFTVEHGCGTSPTIEMKIKFPDGYTNVQPVGKPGWTTAADGNVVTFSAGSLDAKTKDHFDVTVTAPADAGDTNIPIVQSCKVGSLDWVEIAAPGEKEGEHPAATVKITAGAPTAEELAPKEESSSPDAASSSKSSSKAPYVIGGIAAAAAIAVAAFAMARRNRTKAKADASQTR